MDWQKYESIRQFNSLSFQDPTNPLNREEQRKAWQAQSQVNVLVKKTAKAFEIEKPNYIIIFIIVSVLFYFLSYFDKMNLCFASEFKKCEFRKIQNTN